MGLLADPDSAYSLKRREYGRTKSPQELELELEFSKQYDEFATKQNYPPEKIEPYEPALDPAAVKVCLNERSENSLFHFHDLISRV
jgi:hypothetical protein